MNINNMINASEEEAENNEQEQENIQENNNDNNNIYAIEDEYFDAIVRIITHGNGTTTSVVMNLDDALAFRLRMQRLHFADQEIINPLSIEDIDWYNQFRGFWNRGIKNPLRGLVIEEMDRNCEAIIERRMAEQEQRHAEELRRRDEEQARLIASLQAQINELKK